MGAVIGILRRVRRKTVGLVYHLYGYRYKWQIDDLVARGLVLGNNITLSPDAYIDWDFPYLISIGDNCVLTGGVCLLSHEPCVLTGCLRLGRVDIRDNCYLGQNSLILPGVTIGPNVLVAAGSVVDKDVPPNSCVAGVPARVYGSFDGMLDRHTRQFTERAVFPWADIRFTMDKRLIEEVRWAVRDGDAYAQGYTPGSRHLINAYDKRRPK